MIRHFLVHAAGLALLVLAATAVEGDPARPCGPRDAVIAQITEARGESRRAAGLAAGVLVELFADAGTGRWTLTATTAEGRTCLLATGAGFAAFPAPPAGREG